MLGQDRAGSRGKLTANITFICNSYKTGYKLMILRLKINASLMRIITGMQKAIPKGMTFYCLLCLLFNFTSRYQIS